MTGGGGELAADAGRVEFAPLAGGEHKASVTPSVLARWRSASVAKAGRPMVRLDRAVLVSPCCRTDRQTAMLAGCGGVADASPKSTFSHWGAGFLGADAGAEAEGEVGADAAVTVWATRYGQRAWLRQLEPAPGRAMEDALLRTIARLDGTPFPSVARLASGWLRGRVPPLRRDERDASLETAYCAEIVAVTYQAMGLLPGGTAAGLV